MELDLGLGNWRDSLDTNKFLFLLIGTLFLVLWLSLANVGQDNPKLGTTIQLFLWATIVAFIGFLIVKISPSNPYISFLGLGESFNALFIAVAAGAVLAFFAISGFNFSMATFSPALFDLSVLPSLTVLLLIKYASPFGEEFIFAGFLQPTLAMHMGQLQATLLNAGLFAAGHLLAYGGNPEQLVAAFVFRLIVSFGNSYFNSTGFGIGAHFVFNGV